MSAPSILSLRDVAFHRDNRAILDDITFSLGRGEFVSLLGANGAGKSTLLRLALGFISPCSGEVLLNGTSICKLPRRQIASVLAYVPQAHSAPFPFKVREVIELGRLAKHGLFGAPGEADKSAVERAMAMMNITHLADLRYTEISGGERQLVLISRALAQEAEILILDEPTSGLDYGNQIRLLQQLSALTAQGYGILMTTHQPDHALAVSTHAILLKSGKILKSGRPKATITEAAIYALYGVNMTALRKQGFTLGYSSLD